MVVNILFSWTGNKYHTTRTLKNASVNSIHASVGLCLWSRGLSQGHAFACGPQFSLMMGPTNAFQYANSEIVVACSDLPKSEVFSRPLDVRRMGNYNQLSLRFARS